jgi:hypothetical protein
MILLTTFLLSFLIVLLTILAMGIGNVFGRDSIRGSCGGISGRACELCSSERRGGNDADTPASAVVTNTDAKEAQWR